MDYEGETLRMTDLLGESNVLDGDTFTNCTLRGPAVVWFDGDKPITLKFCEFAHELDDLFWEVPRTRLGLIGAVMVRNCTFVSCRFVGIGFAGYEGLRAKIEGNTWNLSPEPES